MFLRECADINSPVCNLWASGIAASAHIYRASGALENRLKTDGFESHINGSAAMARLRAFTRPLCANRLVRLGPRCAGRPSPQTYNLKIHTMTTDETIQIITAASALVVGATIAVRLVRSKFRHEFTVFEGFTGLLYREGKLAEAVGPGRYVRWGCQYQLVSHDTRRTMLNVLGQEVLTSDNAAVKLSLVLTIQITDPKKAVTVVDNYSTHIYSAVQIALRAAVAPTTLEALLTQRITVGEQLRESLAPIADAVGVAVHAVEVRDVMLPGELRKAFTDVLKAKHEGLAALERARSESAALRSLANAARLVAEQPGLATLRFLQTLESGAAKQVVLSDLASFMPTVASRKADG